MTETAPVAQSRPKKPNYSRRIVWLAVFVVVLFGGYSAGWFYVADMVESRADAALAELNRDGVTAECANPVARGYPFRIGLFCDRVAFADAGQGVSLQAGSFRSAGQIYDPMRLVAELDGPAALDLPQGDPISLDWAGLRASARLAEPLPERVSLEGTDLKASATGKPLAAVAAFQAHMRPNGADLDLAGSFEGLRLDRTLVEGRTLPPLSGQSDLTINGGVALVGSPPDSLRGQSGVIRTLTLSSGPETGVQLSGPFSVGQDGLLDAELKVTIRDPDGLSSVLADAFPENRDQIASGFSGLSVLGDEPTLPLKITRGRASLGFIPLGDIPPL
jgi:hypothetical protein